MSKHPAVPVACVFDCTIYLQAAIRDTSPAFACFELVTSGRVLHFISETVEAEVRDVFSRPKLLRKHPRLKTTAVSEFLEVVFSYARRLDEVPETLSYPRDPNDEPYLNLAIVADAQYLVSRDKDLLDLESQRSPVGEELRKVAPRLRIVDPVELLNLMR